MAHIKIEPTKAKRSVQSEEELARILNALSNEVSSIRSNLRYKISGRSQISERLREVSQQIAKESTATRAMSSGLRQIIEKYEQTERCNSERQVADKISPQVADPAAAQQVSDAVENAWAFDGVKLIRKLAKKAVGPFGYWVDLAADYDKEKTTADDIKTVLNDVDLWRKSMTALSDQSGEGLKKLFKVTPMEYTSWGDTFKGELGSFKTPSKAVGTAFSWAKILVDNGAANYKEFDGKWCVRGLEETLVESGIQVAEGVAVTATVSAVTAGICAAAGVACPPVLAVGLAAVGIQFGLDWFLNGCVTLATDGSCTHWVEGLSDVVCNSVDAICKGAGTAVTKVADTIGKGVENISDGIKNFFGGCLWGDACLSGV